MATFVNHETTHCKEGEREIQLVNMVQSLAQIMTSANLRHSNKRQFKAFQTCRTIVMNDPRIAEKVHGSSVATGLNVAGPSLKPKSRRFAESHLARQCPHTAERADIHQQQAFLS